MRRFTRTSVALTTALVVAVASTTVAAGEPEPAPPATPPAGTSVTLLTGDRVLVDQEPGGRAQVTIEPREAGDHRDGFQVHEEDGRTSVIPNDVADLVPGVLDPALFDVTGLVEMGYDDASRDDLPLIVRDGATDTTFSAQRDDPELTSLAAHAIAVDPSEGAALIDDLRDHDGATTFGSDADDGPRVWLDVAVHATDLDGYLTQVEAPAAWSAGLDGTGTTVAVLDTGIDEGHPALAGQVRAAADLTGADDPYDRHGHGTHVASLVAGTGAGSDGARSGIAPAADLLVGKVLDDDGVGQASWIIAGMEWAVEAGADVVNLSLGARAGETDDALTTSLEALAATSDTLFVAAAGNSGGFGFAPFTIESPGVAPSALTVGAVDAADHATTFSSQGPTRGSHRLKPDLVAPGVDIPGARAGARDGELYVDSTGTSQATPLVAGAAALLMQAQPGWGPDQVKAQLVTTAAEVPFHIAWIQGGGRLDLDAASRFDLTSDRVNLDLGYLRHPADEPEARTITLTNHGADELAIEFTTEVAHQAGVPPDETPIDITPNALAIPANSDAEVTVTLDPSVTPPGHWHGSVTATVDGTPALRWPLGFYDEPEAYDLELTAVDRRGEPAAGAEVRLFEANDGSSHRVLLDEDGTATLRTEPGNFSAFSRIITPAHGDQPETFSLAGTAEIGVTADTSLLLDARRALPLAPPVVEGQATEVTEVGLIWARFSDGPRSFIDNHFFDPTDVEDRRVFVTPTGETTVGAFEATQRWQLTPTGRRTGQTPDTYELLFPADRFTDPLTPVLDRRAVREMARLDSHVRSPGGPAELLAGQVFAPDLAPISFVSRRPIQAPRRLTTLLTASPDVSWGRCLELQGAADAELCDRDLSSYETGEQRMESWLDVLAPAAISAQRSFGELYLDIGIGDGVHVGHANEPDLLAEQRLAIHRGDELIDTFDGPFGALRLPAEPAEYRLDHSWTSADGTYPAPSEAATSWTFHSAPPSGFDPDPVPLLGFDHDVAVDDLGRVPAGRPLKLELGVTQLWSTERPDVRTTELAYSIDDGRTWKAVVLRRTAAGSFVGQLPGRSLKSGGHVSLRTNAEATNGDTIEQTLIRALPIS
jgi:subtilisin family serine protease